MLRFVILTGLLFAIRFLAYAQQPVVLEGEITSNIQLTADKTYLLRGFVYVKNGATLSIQPGTRIKGEKSTKGTLIITRTGKISAAGTADKPIVFTSNAPAGEEDYGDWGGIILLGKAKVNCPGGECTIEGGVDNAAGDAKFGGTDDAHSSGTMQYVRIEYPGIAFQTDNEINGLTFGGVGSGTVIDHIQVSYSGDDSFEWFGGTVNCTHLVAYRGYDDDFDTDFGFSGKVQFCVSIRDPRQADKSVSNGFESDNNKDGAPLEPFTHPVFSNMTVIGPQNVANQNGFYGSALHVRRNSKIQVFNSVVTGFPNGFLLDGNSCYQSAQNGDILFKNNVIANCNKKLVHKSIDGDSTQIVEWMSTWMSQNADEFVSDVASLKMKNPTNLDMPDPSLQNDSPLMNGASFSSPALQVPQIQSVSYRGAFGTTNWLDGWVSFTGGKVIGVNEKFSPETTLSIYPNPVTENAELSFTLENSAVVSARLMDLNGRIVREMVSPTHYPAQAHRLTFSLDRLSAGVYGLEIQIGTRTITKKIVYRPY